MKTRMGIEREAGRHEPPADHLKALEEELVDQAKLDAEEALAMISSELLHDSPVPPGLGLKPETIDPYLNDAFSGLGNMDAEVLRGLAAKYKEAFYERFTLGGTSREQ